MKVIYDAGKDRAEIINHKGHLIIWSHDTGGFVIFTNDELRITPLMRSHILVEVVKESEEE